MSDIGKGSRSWHQEQTIERLQTALAASQARPIRMVELMRKLREPDWHFESIREFQRELSALEDAAIGDDTALRERLKAERERCAKTCEELDPHADDWSDSEERAESRIAKGCADAIRNLGDE